MDAVSDDTSGRSLIDAPIPYLQDSRQLLWMCVLESKVMFLEVQLQDGSGCAVRVCTAPAKLLM